MRADFDVQFIPRRGADYNPVWVTCRSDVSANDGSTRADGLRDGLAKEGMRPACYLSVTRSAEV